jgi:hypothetical protein
MRNRLTPNWVWELPEASTHWNNWFSRWTLDSWEVSGIASFISGQPMTVNVSTTNNENITGGGDGVATKNFRIKDRANVALRTETYNTFNHPQWSTANNTAQFDPSTGDQVNSALGMITGDRGPRIMQLALRVNF